MLRIPSILTNVSLTHDKGLRLSFLTNEMTGPEKQEAIELHDTFGYLLFAPNPISNSDVPKDLAEDKSKTPSKRYRNTLFVLHNKLGKPPEEFDKFYRQRIEMDIDTIKEEIRAIEETPQ